MSLVRERSLIDRIPGFRRAPLNISMLAVAGDATAHIVAEGIAKPLSKFSMARVTVTPRKITAACVVTDELLRFSSGLAEVSLGSELAKAVGLQMDRRFIDPDVVDSISNGATVISSSGSSLAAVDSDLKAMFAVFATQDSALDSAVFSMSSTTAVYLASLRGSGGNPAFPNITARGGNLLGIPVYISGALIASGSPGEGAIVLFDPAQILLGDEGQMDVTVARNASVQLSDTPTSPATETVSLFQANLLALRAERWCGWSRQAATSVVVLDNVQY
jgi:HK97 family phage major capsid protein